VRGKLFSPPAISCGANSLVMRSVGCLVLNMRRMSRSTVSDAWLALKGCPSICSGGLANHRVLRPGDVTEQDFCLIVGFAVEPLSPTQDPLELSYCAFHPGKEQLNYCSSSALLYPPQGRRYLANWIPESAACPQVNRDGSLESIPGCENFPDTHAAVLGKEIGSIPDILTT